MGTQHLLVPQFNKLWRHSSLLPSKKGNLYLNQLLATMDFIHRGKCSRLSIPSKKMERYSYTSINKQWKNEWWRALICRAYFKKSARRLYKFSISLFKSNTLTSKKSSIVSSSETPLFSWKWKCHKPELGVRKITAKENFLMKRPSELFVRWQVGSVSFTNYPLLTETSTRANFNHLEREW